MTSEELTAEIQELHSCPTLKDQMDRVAHVECWRNLIGQVVSATGAFSAGRETRRSNIACSKRCSEVPIVDGDYEEYEDWKCKMEEEFLDLRRRIGRQIHHGSGETGSLSRSAISSRTHITSRFHGPVSWDRLDEPAAVPCLGADRGRPLPNREEHGRGGGVLRCWSLDQAATSLQREERRQKPETDEASARRQKKSDGVYGGSPWHVHVGSCLERARPGYQLRSGGRDHCKLLKKLVSQQNVQGACEAVLLRSVHWGQHVHHRSGWLAHVYRAESSNGWSKRSQTHGYEPCREALETSLSSHTKMMSSTWMPWRWKARAQRTTVFFFFSLRAVRTSRCWVVKTGYMMRGKGKSTGVIHHSNNCAIRKRQVWLWKCGDVEGWADRECTLWKIRTLGNVVLATVFCSDWRWRGRTWGDSEVQGRSTMRESPSIHEVSTVRRQTQKLVTKDSVERPRPSASETTLQSCGVRRRADVWF